jgi:outer membrane protein OmpA-like peptidoglycan-associated protein
MKWSLLVFVFTVTSNLTAISQNVVLKSPAEIALEKAKELLDDEKYADAAKKLEGIVLEDPTNQMATYYLASAYQGLNQSDKAEKYFEKVSELMAADSRTRENSTSEFQYHKWKYMQRFAKEQSRLLKSLPTMSDPVKLTVVVNSAFGDYGPIINPTGSRLYFTSTRPDEPTAVKKSFIRNIGDQVKKTDPKSTEDEDSYYTDKDAGTWGTPVKLPAPLNTDNNEGVDCFTADNQMMIFTACGLADGYGSCDLYFSTLEGSNWQSPKNLGNIVNSAEWDGQSTISYDGTKIFFASGRADGYGGIDLYMVEKNIFGEWGPASNLGGMVNTIFNEYSPFISQDGKTLYFSSDGHPGFGGLDIFKTVYENGKWSAPVNLGKPLNTTRSDKFFSIGGAGEVGYFSSDRDGTGMDIYQIEIPEEMRPQPTIIISGIVSNAKTSEPVAGFVMVEDIDTGELIAVNKSNSVTGKYLVVLPGGRNYSVSANKEGFFFYSQNFEVAKKAHYQEIVKDISLKPIEKGTKVVINNIFFEIGKATLTSQSHLELEKAVDLLRGNPTMIIEIGGHTDNVGEDASNMKLSHERAKSVREYLVGRGLNGDRVQAKGYGELNPIASNDTDDGRKANRRTEFVILDY